jgi:anti-sigma28 factor (negative regulator of flagellin synthesis)
MAENRDVRVDQIRERVGRGEYRADPRAVADAIIRRLQERSAAPPAPKPLQKECS